jgi:transposase InsO family protein
MAIKTEHHKGLFHSDRGVQYVKKFTNVVDSYKIITRSRSRKGNCWDNAVAESFFKTLKKNKIMEINLYQKNRWNEIFELKFGTIEKEGIQL